MPSSISRRSPTIRSATCDPSWTYAINLDGTIALARAAKEAGVGRFVFASSCSMYGAASSDDLLDENAPLRPLTPYAESKVRSEEALDELADTDFSPVSMRNATAYGISPRFRLDVVLNNLTRGRTRPGRSACSRRLRLAAARARSRHRRAAAELLVAPRDVVAREAFNIGSEDQNVPVRDLADVLRRSSGVRGRVAAAPPDPRSYRVDFSRLRAALPAFRCEWNVVRVLPSSQKRTPPRVDVRRLHRRRPVHETRPTEYGSSIVAVSTTLCAGNPRSWRAARGDRRARRARGPTFSTP